MCVRGGGGGGGAKEECRKECYYNDKTIDLFSTSSVMLLSGLKIHHHLIEIS